VRTFKQINLFFIIFSNLNEPNLKIMNSTENVFSIKDLENISGVKAHTIRIWEKRYNLLQPKRTETNIRHYDLHNLQKLLNISFLNNNGFKISKIDALMSLNWHQKPES
jgi:DNA-binding transcriptional MerR regulator